MIYADLFCLRVPPFDFIPSLCYNKWWINESSSSAQCWTSLKTTQNRRAPHHKKNSFFISIVIYFLLNMINFSHSVDCKLLLSRNTPSSSSSLMLSFSPHLALNYVKVPFCKCPSILLLCMDNWPIWNWIYGRRLLLFHTHTHHL